VEKIIEIAKKIYAMTVDLPKNILYANADYIIFIMVLLAELVFAVPTEMN
jgi:hypothetical protein